MIGAYLHDKSSHFEELDNHFVWGTGVVCPPSHNRVADVVKNASFQLRLFTALQLRLFTALQLRLFTALQLRLFTALQLRICLWISASTAARQCSVRGFCLRKVLCDCDIGGWCGCVVCCQTFTNINGSFHFR